MKKSLRIPLSSVVQVRHDPDPRHSISAKLRKRAGRTGVFRLGTYHSLEGWSFWAIGLGRNSVVIETEGVRYRFVVIEVEDPGETVSRLRQAAGLPQ